MAEWHKDQSNKNFKYKRETLLNYGMSRWGLNKSSSVGKTSELIRDCAPKEFDDWVEYYFQNAKQNKKDGIYITRQYLKDLGEKLYVKLSEVVSCELKSISCEECVDYVYNLVINRTYEGYITEVKTIYGFLEKALGCSIQPAPDEWDRSYGVDFYIEIADEHYIGIQIKPVTGKPLDDYQWRHMHQKSHERFSNKYHGSVFFVLSKTINGKKQIKNIEIIGAIKQEIDRIKQMI